jgi:hypothetical protein
VNTLVINDNEQESFIERKRSKERNEDRKKINKQIRNEKEKVTK